MKSGPRCDTVRPVSKRRNCRIGIIESEKVKVRAQLFLVQPSKPAYLVEEFLAQGCRIHHVQTGIELYQGVLGVQAADEGMFSDERPQCRRGT